MPGLAECWPPSVVLDHRVQLEALLGIAFIEPDADCERLVALIAAEDRGERAKTQGGARGD
jgi:hypothetical protein